MTVETDMKNKIFLFPWSEKGVSKSKKAKADKFDITLIGQRDKFVEKVDGVYSEYREGLFHFFRQDNEVHFGWDTLNFCINDVEKIEWSVQTFFRELKVTLNTAESHIFRYHSFCQNWYSVSEVLNYIFDDGYWEILEDLPSTVYDVFCGESITYDEIFDDFSKYYEFEK